MYDRSKPYNSLPLLTANHEVERDIEVLNKLVKASRALATVDIQVQRLPNPFILVNTIALQEAQASVAIENIFTTDDELYKAISEEIKEERANLATKEVLRYREAMWQGYNDIMSHSGVSKQAIINIFRQVKDTTAGLRPPQALVSIKRGESDFRSGEVIYTPPRGEALLEALMENLVNYLNDDEAYPADALLKMCIAHYQFEAIHPFNDGNGRTGRILNLLYLVSKGLLSQPTLYLSKYIINNKNDYYYNLGAVTQRGSWKAWVMYMLDAVESTSKLTGRLISEILEQMQATQQYGTSKFKWYNKEFNEVIFNQPYIKPQAVASVLNRTSRQTLTRYFQDMVQAGILSPRKDGKEVYYVNNDLVRILGG